MSIREKTATDEAFQELRHDDVTREHMEILAERDDVLGAQARVFLDVVDGDQPTKADCREAGLMSIWERLESGDRP